MDQVSKYYLKKSNLAAQDEYLARIDEEDIQILKKARRYLIAAPCVTIGMLYFLKQFRMEGGFSSNFKHSIERAREAYSEKQGAQSWSKPGASEWPAHGQ